MRLEGEEGIIGNKYKIEPGAKKEYFNKKPWERRREAEELHSRCGLPGLYAWQNNGSCFCILALDLKAELRGQWGLRIADCMTLSKSHKGITVNVAVFAIALLQWRPHGDHMILKFLKIKCFVS